MSKRILSVLLAIVLLILLVGFMLPREVTVQRSQSIEASPEAVFAVLNDLRYFNQWSPWAQRDPEASYRLEGPASGPGSTLVWDGQGGGGRLWIVDAHRPERVDLMMELGDATVDTGFNIRASDGASNGGSEVTWTMQARFGALDLTGRYIGLMLPALVGPDYRRGLERLAAYFDAHQGQRPPVPDELAVGDFPSADPAPR